MIRPLFSFFGAKWRLAPRYPAPAHGTIIEPFAGSAGYACRYPDRQVILVERDPVIAALWAWLIGAPAEEILALPLLGEDLQVPGGLRPEASSLIGFWCNKGSTSPRRQLTSTWGRKYPDQFWGANMRARVAQDVQRIRHWTVIAGSYDAAPDIAATWFIDPPYVGRSRIAKLRGGGPAGPIPVGDRYRFGTRRIDYAALGAWVRSRRGQVIACEAAGAAWLDFRPFARVMATGGVRETEEVVWLSE